MKKSSSPWARSENFGVTSLLMSAPAFVMPHEQFLAEFLAFQKDLRSYLLRILGTREDADDLAQDAFIKASKNLSTFKGDSSLKTWVFSIATNLARDHFRGRQRWIVDAQSNARDHAQEDPRLNQKIVSMTEKSQSGRFEIKEHIDFCFTCMGKTLTIEQQVALILKEVYEFKVTEIMRIMALAEGKVKHAIADGRKTLMGIFNKKCALVNKKGACHQCTELNGIVNPKQNEQEELMKIKMVQDARQGKTRLQLYKLRMHLIKNIDPMECQGSDLYSYFLGLMPAYSGLENIPKAVARAIVQ